MEIYTLVKYVRWEGGDNLAYFTHKPTVDDIMCVPYIAGLIDYGFNESKIARMLSEEIGIKFSDVTLSIQKIKVKENGK